jgi:hypothetical protein
MPEADIAISLSEVTIGQWNACVRDKVCAPYTAMDGNTTAVIVGLSQHAANDYARWLSRITGHTYSIVMPEPVSDEPRPGKNSPECRDSGPPRVAGGWQWLEDRSGSNCPPSLSESEQAMRSYGFRVARRVGNDG